jgi:hypothetical protein
MLYQTISIHIDQIACDRNSLFKTMQDMQNGKISYSGSKPLDIFFVSEGKYKDKYVLKDGYHRLFALMLQGKKEIQVFVDEIGDY